MDNEVSINIEDAIATAEEINKGSMDQHLQKYSDDEIEGGDQDDDRYSDAEEDLASAQAIAGIVTDGHNEKDQFD